MLDDQGSFARLLGIIALVAGGLMALRLVPPNYFIGMRTRETLRNRELWYVANRYAGRMMVVYGVYLLVIGTLLQRRLVFSESPLFHASVIACIVLPFAWIAARALRVARNTTLPISQNEEERRNID